MASAMLQYMLFIFIYMVKHLTWISLFNHIMQMFQKGSPFARDFSKAILQLSEEGELTNLESKWLSQSNQCTNSSSSNDTQSLKLESFWVLFVISGVTSTICLLFSIIQSQGFYQLSQNIFHRQWTHKWYDSLDKNKRIRCNWLCQHH